VSPEDIKFKDLSPFDQHLKLMTELIIGRNDKTLTQTEQDVLINVLDKLFDSLEPREQLETAIKLLDLQKQYPKAFL
jgi:hypothetical protein